MGPAIGWVGETLQQAPGFQIIDEAHHPARRYAQIAGDRLLRPPALGADGPHQPVLARLEPERLQTTLKGPPCQVPDPGHHQSERLFWIGPQLIVGGRGASEWGRAFGHEMIVTEIVSAGIIPSETM